MSKDGDVLGEFPHVGAGAGNMAEDGAVTGSVAEALRLASASMDYLLSPEAADLDGAGCGEALAALSRVQAKLAAARVALLRRFDALDGHDGDGYGSCTPWLTARAGETKSAARAQVRQMRRLSARPDLEAALGRAALTESQAGDIAEWTRQLPQDLRAATDKILVQAAEAGAATEDLAVIAAAAIEQWRRQRPDPDEDESRFGDRSLRLGVTFGGAALLRGELTPECAAAVRAVLESLGKKRGAEDDRSEAQRFHDALQEACQLLLRARLTPDRVGSDTQVVAHIPLSQLRQMPGAQDLEEAWLHARLGDDGAMTGTDAETAACDAQTVPVVTGYPDMDVIDKMISLADAGARARADVPAGAATAGDAPAGGVAAGTRAGTGAPDGGLIPGAGPAGGSSPAGPSGLVHPRGPDGKAARETPRERSSPLPAEAWQALRYAMARLAIDFVSGPHGVAAVLRQGLLEHPWNIPSQPLDIGYADSIPSSIRRAVAVRDRHCAWPRCDRPAAVCDVHHLVHKKDGGETSVGNCALLCQYHHDVCVHRWGWRLIHHPDGTWTATSPDGRKILTSHGPPGRPGANPPPGTRAA
jgi:hypothetical protein